MPDPVTVLIDADPLVYRIGFACERASYSLEWVDVDPEHRDDPDWDTVHLAFFQSAWRVEEFCHLLNLHPDEVTRRREIDPEPLNFALRSMRESIDGILKDVEQYLKFHGKVPGDVKLFLTGGNQFRDRLAKIKPYKGNRDRSKRPFWYKDLREYLVSVWGADVSEVIEADDAVALRQWQTEELGASIICTIDKDLLMVPGHHLNCLSKKAFTVTASDAILTFYRQLLTGDATDNIPGCYKVGGKTAKELLPIVLTEEEMFEVALDAYARNIEKFPQHHAPHTDPVASLTENARLLWMLDAPDRLWAPPGQEQGSIRAFMDSLVEDPDA